MPEIIWSKKVTKLCWCKPRKCWNWKRVLCCYLSQRAHIETKEEKNATLHIQPSITASAEPTIRTKLCANKTKRTRNQEIKIRLLTDKLRKNTHLTRNNNYILHISSSLFAWYDVGARYKPLQISHIVQYLWFSAIFPFSEWISAPPKRHQDQWRKE